MAARYTYDAWGKPLTITDGNGVDVSEDPNHIANLNPLRYRGYYWDSETGLYYCQSRYYDPETGRFINADGMVDTGQGIIGNNMFAYCLNNPVNRLDPSGQASSQEIQNIIDELLKRKKSTGKTLADLLNVKSAEAAAKTTPKNPWLVPQNVQAQNNSMISGLDPKLQPKAKEFLAVANDAGYALFITWGKRTDEDIAYINSHGGKTGKSAHYYGKAFDVQIWDTAYTDLWPGTDGGNAARFWSEIYNYAPIQAEVDPRFKNIGAIGQRLGLTWGGTFTPYDPVHFQINWR